MHGTKTAKYITGGEVWAEDKMQTFENLNSQYLDMVKPLHAGCVNIGVACK